MSVERMLVTIAIAVITTAAMVTVVIVELPSDKNSCGKKWWSDCCTNAYHKKVYLVTQYTVVTENIVVSSSFKEIAVFI